MEKLSERIRKYPGLAAEQGCDIMLVPHGPVCDQWAREVASLEAENERLREANIGLAGLSFGYMTGNGVPETMARERIRSLGGPDV